MPDPQTVAALSGADGAPAPPSQPQPSQAPSQSPAPDNSRGSLFRGILSGALLGMIGGLSKRDPDNPIGASVGAGADRVVSEQQRNLGNTLALQQNQRANTETGLNVQRLALDTSNIQSEIELRKAQGASLMTQDLLVHKQIAGLPDNYQQKIIDDARPEVQKLLDSHTAVPVLTMDGPDAYTSLQQEMVRQINQSGDHSFQIVPNPSGKQGSWMLIKNAPGVTLDKAQTVTLGGRTITFPKGSESAPYYQAAQAAQQEAARNATTIAQAKILAAKSFGIADLKGIDDQIKGLQKADADIDKVGIQALNNQSFWQAIGVTPPPGGLSSAAQAHLYVKTYIQQLQNQRQQLLSGVGLGGGKSSTPRIASQADIAGYAQQKKITPDQAKKEFESAGFTIQ
jgi:hypothetical protein